jgi:hypothetical protein
MGDVPAVQVTSAQIGATLAPVTLRRRVWLLVTLCGLLIVGAAALPRIAQDPAYHAFADARGLGPIPNVLNVVSNVAFLVVGALGLRFLARNRRRARSEAFVTPEERRPFEVFFAGVALTSVGSAYYHWRPDNTTLFWDRLPMTVGFMALLASVIAERLSVRTGARSLAPLVLVGAASALYWHLGELRGVGDLRPYALVQFGSMILIPVMLAFFPPRYTRTADFVGSLGWYLVAKAPEYFDHAFLRLTGVSGHTWKHLASAVAAYWILRMLERRHPTTPATAVADRPGAPRGARDAPGIRA